MDDDAIVADAGPLIALARVQALAAPSRLFAKVWITEAVLAECLAKPERQDALAIRGAVQGGLMRVAAAPEGTGTASHLGLGEASAIALASELGAGLLVDDRIARRHAVGVGLRVFGTLGILVAAKRAGILPSVQPSLTALVRSGYFLSGDAIVEALRLAGECDAP